MKQIKIIILPSNLEIELPLKANYECEFIKSFIEIDSETKNIEIDSETKNIEIKLPFELTDTHLLKYELEIDDLATFTEHELDQWLQLKAYLCYVDTCDKFDNEKKLCREVASKYHFNQDLLNPYSFDFPIHFKYFKEIILKCVEFDYFDLLKYI